MIDELTTIAFNSKKELIPVEELVKRSQQILKTYNRNYLRAEIQQANNSALAIEKWNSFSDDDRYILQYRTAKDEREREDHRILDGITLPKSDSFWDEFMPPNDWGCRCTVVEVLASRYKKSEAKEVERVTKNVFTEKSKIFAYNPGKENLLFSKKSSYYKTTSSENIKNSITTNHRKYIQNFVLNTLKQNKFEYKELNSEIMLTTKGLKECINQPHKNYFYKNQAIVNIKDRILNGDLVKENGKALFIENTKNDRFKGFYLIETTINKEKSWILLKLEWNNELSLYTIVDKIKRD